MQLMYSCTDFNMPPVCGGLHSKGPLHSMTSSQAEWCELGMMLALPD